MDDADQGRLHHGRRVVSETGILGDPSEATAAQGHGALDAVPAMLIRDVAAWHPGQGGA